MIHGLVTACTAALQGGFPVDVNAAHFAPFSFCKAPFVHWLQLRPRARRGSAGDDLFPVFSCARKTHIRLPANIKTHTHTHTQVASNKNSLTCNALEILWPLKTKKPRFCCVCDPWCCGTGDWTRSTLPLFQGLILVYNNRS